MAKEFERRTVNRANRLIKSICNTCRHPVAASRSKSALKIAEEAHLRNNAKCGEAAKSKSKHYEPGEAPHRPSHQA